MPIVGVVSDKFGRMATIVGNAIFGSILGVIQAYSISFEMYVGLELLIAMTSAGIVSTAFIFSAEWVSSKHRVAFATINGVGLALSSILIGVAAMVNEQNFRAFKLWMSLPSLSAIGYYLLLRESPRWLLAGQKYKEAIRSIKYAAKMNGKSLSDKMAEEIEQKSIRAIVLRENCSQNDEQSFWNVMHRKQLAFRFVTLSIVWVCSLFAMYGVMLGSKSLHENKYMSYIIVALAELPGVFLGHLILDHGRRMAVGGTLFIHGLAIIISIFLNDDLWILRLILNAAAKIALTTTLLSLYAYTSELWPTNVRNTTMNVCSMLGRIGGILATLSDSIIRGYPYLLPLLCGLAAFLASILTFVFLPETLNKKLPDTIDEAIAIDENKRENV